MKFFANRRLVFAWSLVAMLLPMLAEAAVVSDIAAPAKRRGAVELANKLAAPATVAPLPDDLIQPFNPTAFGQPDPEELRAMAAAASAEAAASAQSKPATEREVLAHLAERIVPSGTLFMGGEALLIFGQKRLRVGDRLTVTYDGRDYDLELAAIDRSTFTLRLNSDQITRRINPGKKP